MELIDLLLSHMFLSERDYLTEEIVIEIMPVYEVIVVTYDSELTEDLNLRSEFLVELS